MSIAAVAIECFAFISKRNDRVSGEVSSDC
jgi:hypothetical protein